MTSHLLKFAFQTYIVFVTFMFLTVLAINISDYDEFRDIFGRAIPSIYQIPIAVVVITAIPILLIYYYTTYAAYRKKRNEQYGVAENTNASDRFIVINIPEKIKNIFIDALRAFESYTKLSGYEAKFSFENSEKDKLRFKFTIIKGSKHITVDNVRDDLVQFLRTIQKDEKIENTATGINTAEYRKMLATLNSRINVLKDIVSEEHLERRITEIIDKIIEKIINSKNFNHSINIHNHIGENNMKQIHAKDSNIILGNNNAIEDNSININHSFNEKKTIIDTIDNSIKLVQQDDKLNDKDKEVLELHLKNIKHEIEEEAQPDASLLKRYWDKIKGVGERVIFSHELSQALGWIGEKFGFVTDFLNNIPS